MKAQQALRVAGNVVHLLAGWAIDHVAGLAKHGLDPLEYEMEGERLDDYEAARAQRDSHIFEKAGNREILTIDREQARRALINLLFYNPGAFPEVLQCDILEAFERIGRGAPDDLFKLVENGSRYNWEKVQLQLQIISVIAYRYALNRTPIEVSWDDIVGIAQRVGAKITSFETIKSWEPRLRKKLGDRPVDRFIRHGEAMGRKVKQARIDRASGALSNDEEVYSAHLNDDALRRYLESYAALPRK